MRFAAPEVPHRVAILAVPLRPQRREVAHLIASLADIPGLGDQLGARQVSGQAVERGIFRRDIAPDDISSVYETLASEREDAGDEAGQKKVLGERATFLEAAATKAKTPEARAVFDSHRLGTYLDLKEPERAIPMLQASERDLPGDYNPPARLAVAYRAMKKYDEALAASDRALAKAYGPRKLGILQTRSDIYKEMGNLPEARKAMQQAVELAESLPEGQRSEKSIASLKKKLEAL